MAEETTNKEEVQEEVQETTEAKVVKLLSDMINGDEDLYTKILESKLSNPFNQIVNLARGRSEDGTIEDEKYNQLNDKYLRSIAEFENFKRRTALEKTKLIQTANEKAVIEMLSVEDNFERAEKDEPLSDGMQIVRKDLINSLSKLGVSKMDCIDKEFDAEIHQALTQVPGDEEKKGIIIDVVENGYTMGDKVIRFPKVVVGCQIDNYEKNY